MSAVLHAHIPPTGQEHFSMLSCLLTDANEAETAGATSLTALSKIGMLLFLSYRCHSEWRSSIVCIKVNLFILAWCYCICWANCNKKKNWHSFWQQMQRLPGECFRTKSSLCTWHIRPTEKIRKKASLDYLLFWTVHMKEKVFSLLWFIPYVLTSLAAITEACQDWAKVILLMTLKMDHPDVCGRLARKTK